MTGSIWGRTRRFLVHRTRRFLVRRQLAIFVSMIAAGALLVGLDDWIDGQATGQGIAFIIVGFVGILMSWTTFDIGAGIKEVVREVGRQNREALDTMAKSQEAMNERIIASLDSLAKSQDNLAKSQDSANKRIMASLDSLAKSQDRMAKSQDRMAKSQDNMAKSQDSTNKRIIASLDSLAKSQEKIAGVLARMEKKDNEGS